MDDSNETGGPLGSSSFFGRISAGHCDMDNMAFSPSTSDYSPYLYVPIRKSSLLTSSLLPEANTAGTGSDMPERRNSRKDSMVYSPKRKLSNISTTNYQSFDNLQQLMKENQQGVMPGDFDNVNFGTQSLPATPLTTPHGSPKSERHQFSNKKFSADETHYSIPWYYSGFVAAHHAPKNSDFLVCTTEQQAPNKASQSLGVTSGFNSGMSLNSKFPTRTGHAGCHRRYNPTNRDMNFLAPTSM